MKTPSPQNPGAAAAKDLKERNAQEYMNYATDCPNKKLFFGLKHGLDQLPDPSMAKAGQRNAQARTLLKKIDAIDHDTVTNDDKIDLKLIRLSLEKDIHDINCTFNGHTNAEQCPRAGHDIGNGISHLLISHALPQEERLELIQNRIALIPEYLREAAITLKRPVSNWIQVEEKQLLGLEALFDAVEAVPQKHSDDHKRNRQRAEEAIANYIGEVKEKSSSTNFAIGEKDAQEVLRNRGIMEPPEDLYTLAKTFETRHSASLKERQTKLIEKHKLQKDTSTQDLCTWLNNTFQIPLGNTPATDIINHYKDEANKVCAYIKERNLFPLINTDNIRIMETPPHLQPCIPAGAMVPPAPLASGKSESIVYLTLTKEQIPSHSLLSVPTMMIHECIPGHHLQLSWAAAHPSKIRRMYDAAAYAEGWATMQEQYMLDAGYAGPLTEESYFIMEVDQGRFAARTCIDLFFMTGQHAYLELGPNRPNTSLTTFGNAAALLRTLSGFNEARIKGELDFYSQERGYPSAYLIGNHKARNLRKLWHDRSPRQSSTQEADRLFHEIYLKAGNMPLDCLKQVFEDYSQTTP
jgi:uncharacterized protein (DUF885 family)